MTTPSPAVDLYTDPDVFERERQSIFARTWLFFGIEADFARPGDYLADIVADFPIVVVRDAEGTLRGFHNVCRHRAGPLVDEGRGRCEREFVCRYHAWRYAFDGALTDTGEFPPPEGLDIGAFGLFRVRVETWRGLVFINLDPAAEPLEATLRPLEARLRLDRSRTARVQHSHKIDCNWKVFVENYLDGFHLEGVHAVVADEAGAQHHAIQVEGKVAFCQPPETDRSARNFWAWVWPNVGFCLYRGVFVVEHMRPRGAGAMRLEHIYLHEPEDPGIDAAMSETERVSDEDAWVCERVQRNLRAGVFHEGVISPGHDGAVAWFQARVAEALAG